MAAGETGTQARWILAWWSMLLAAGATPATAGTTRTCTVEGRVVVAGTEAPPPNARVWITSLSHPLEPGPDGSFRALEVPCGGHDRVFAVAPGHGAGQPISLLPHGSKPYDLELVPGERVAGRVHDALLRTPPETRVELQLREGPVFARTRADRHGRFELPGCPRRAACIVRAHAAGIPSVFRTLTERDRGKRIDGHDDVHLVLTPGHRVTGRILAGVDPAVGASIRLGAATTTTDEAGRFTFLAVSPGEQVFEVTTDGREPLRETLEVGGAAPGFVQRTLPEPPNATVELRVLDAEGQPVPQDELWASVSIEGWSSKVEPAREDGLVVLEVPSTASEAVIRRTRHPLHTVALSLERGGTTRLEVRLPKAWPVQFVVEGSGEEEALPWRFRLERAEGRERVLVLYPRRQLDRPFFLTEGRWYARATFRGDPHPYRFVSFDVPTGGPVRVDPAPTGRVGGVVLDTRRRPLAGVDVCLFHDLLSTCRTTRTDADGRFSFEDADAQRQTVFVSLPGVGGGVAHAPGGQEDLELVVE